MFEIVFKIKLFFLLYSCIKVVASFSTKSKPSSSSVFENFYRICYSAHFVLNTILYNISRLSDVVDVYFMSGIRAILPCQWYSTRSDTIKLYCRLLLIRFSRSQCTLLGTSVRLKMIAWNVHTTLQVIYWLRTLQ